MNLSAVLSVKLLTILELKSSKTIKSLYLRNKNQVLDLCSVNKPQHDRGHFCGNGNCVAASKILKD